jgi:hypothetical protein
MSNFDLTRYIVELVCKKNNLHINRNLNLVNIVLANKLNKLNKDNKQGFYDCKLCKGANFYIVESYNVDSKKTSNVKLNCFKCHERRELNIVKINSNKLGSNKKLAIEI